MQREERNSRKQANNKEKGEKSFLGRIWLLLTDIPNIYLGWAESHTPVGPRSTLPGYSDSAGPNHCQIRLGRPPHPAGPASPESGLPTYPHPVGPGYRGLDYSRVPSGPALVLPGRPALGIPGRAEFPLFGQVESLQTRLGRRSASHLAWAKFPESWSTPFSPRWVGIQVSDGLQVCRHPGAAAESKVDRHPGTPAESTTSQHLGHLSRIIPGHSSGPLVPGDIQASNIPSSKS